MITNKKLKLLAACFLATLLSSAQPNFQWAKQLGGTGSEFATSIATDLSGNVYSVGHFVGTADFDPGASVYNLASNGNNDFYVSKLDASGNFVWACSFGSTNSDYAFTIVVDASNNVCIGGVFQGTVDFDPGIGIANLTSAGGNDVFILKLNQYGNYVWSSRIGGPLGDDFSSLTIDGSGNTYATGGFAGTSDFDPGIGIFNLTANGAADAFVLKLDIAGNYLWAKKMGGSGADYGQGIATDGSGNVITNGLFNGVTDFDPNIGVFNLTEYGNGDMYISMLNSAGNFVWAKQIGGTGADVPNTLEISSTGNLLMTGQFNGLADFDPGIGTYTLSSAATDEFILKLDPSGNFIWANQFGALTGESAKCVRTDLFQNVYILGSYNGTVDFDFSPATYTLTSAGSSDVFILKLDGLGNFIWAKQFGGNSADAEAAMCLDVNNNIYSTGLFTGTADFDPNIGITNLISFGGFDSFVHKMNQCSAPSSPTNITSPLNQTICNGSSTLLSASSTGTVTWYANPTGTTVLATGTSYTTSALSTGTYTFYAEASTCTVSATRTAITLTVNATPTISVNSGSICSGSSFTINPSGANTYTISGGSAIVTPTTNTSYNVTGTSAQGCVSSNTAVSSVTVNAIPVVSVNSGSICSGSSFTINPSGANTYTISGGSAIVTPTTNVSYNVTGTSAQGCLSSNTAISSVTVNSLPNVTAISNNTLLCTGQTASLTASGASTYLWNTSATTSVIAVSPTITINYTVTGTDANGCSNSVVFTQSVSACTGIASVNTKNSNISIYPNPSNGVFTISGIELNTTISVYNAIGEFVKSIQSTDNNITIDISNYSNGIYFIKIKNNNGEAIQKLIKQ